MIEEPEGGEISPAQPKGNNRTGNIHTRLDAFPWIAPTAPGAALPPSFLPTPTEVR